MTRYEGVCGTAEADAHYGYLAVRPPLTEGQIASFVGALTDRDAKILYVVRLCTDTDPVTTEFELRSPVGFDESIENRSALIPAAKLGMQLRGSGDVLDLMPGIVSVEGDAPLFEQHAEQYIGTLATQSS